MAELWKDLLIKEEEIIVDLYSLPIAKYVEVSMKSIYQVYGSGFSGRRLKTTFIPLTTFLLLLLRIWRAKRFRKDHNHHKPAVCCLLFVKRHF